MPAWPRGGLPGWLQDGTAAPACALQSPPSTRDFPCARAAELCLLSQVGGGGSRLPGVPWTVSVARPAPAGACCQLEALATATTRAAARGRTGPGRSSASKRLLPWGLRSAGLGAPSAPRGPGRGREPALPPTAVGLARASRAAAALPPAPSQPLSEPRHEPSPCCVAFDFLRQRSAGRAGRAGERRVGQGDRRVHCETWRRPELLARRLLGDLAQHRSVPARHGLACCASRSALACCPASRRDSMPPARRRRWFAT